MERLSSRQTTPRYAHKEGLNSNSPLNWSMITFLCSFHNATFNHHLLQNMTSFRPWKSWNSLPWKPVPLSPTLHLPNPKFHFFSYQIMDCPDRVANFRRFPYRWQGSPSNRDVSYRRRAQSDRADGRRRAVAFLAVYADRIRASAEQNDPKRRLQTLPTTENPSDRDPRLRGGGGWGCSRGVSERY